MNPERVQQKGPKDGPIFKEKAMEGHIKCETIKGEKSGFGRAREVLAGWPYEKIMVARTLFVILLGLLALIFFGHQQ